MVVATSPLRSKPLHERNGLLTSANIERFEGRTFVLATKVFPSTELPSYAEPVSPDQMQVGRVYFALHYSDPDLLVPYLYPLIFLGCDLDGSQRNMRFFQHFDSYRDGVRYDGHAADESECFEAYGSDEGKHIFDYEHAVRSLMRCALNRRDVADVDERIRHSAESGAGESHP
jgi:hypothetical protein